MKFRLINSTIQTIAENGLSAVTLAKVASQAGLSFGLVQFTPWTLGLAQH